MEENQCPHKEAVTLTGGPRLCTRCGAMTQPDGTWTEGTPWLLVTQDIDAPEDMTQDKEDAQKLPTTQSYVSAEQMDALYFDGALGTTPTAKGQDTQWGVRAIDRSFGLYAYGKTIEEAIERIGQGSDVLIDYLFEKGGIEAVRARVRKAVQDEARDNARLAPQDAATDQCEHRWVHPAWRFCEKCLIPEPPSPAMQAATPTVVPQDAQDGDWRAMGVADGVRFGQIGKVAVRGEPRPGAEIRNLQGMCELANTLTARVKELEQERETTKQRYFNLLDALTRCLVAVRKNSGEQLSNSEIADRVEGLTARVKELEQERDDLESIFDLQHKRDMELVKRWRAEGRIAENALPDYGRGLEWLLDRAEAAEARVREAERERDENATWANDANQRSLIYERRAEAAETKLQQEREAHEETERALHLSREGYKDRVQRLEQALREIEAAVEHDGDEWPELVDTIARAALEEA